MNTAKTIDYYNKHAQTFVEGTISVDLGSIYAQFVSRLPDSARILDFGCGSGRDAKYFLSQGYMVDAADGSQELCALASQHAGIPVRHMLFQDLNDVQRYDGIWACSSILHLSRVDLKVVLEKMIRALRERGIIYTSFKYGTFEGERNGRYFIDMTEDSFAELLRDVGGAVIEAQWITSDARPGRGEEKWLNLILRKQ